MSHFIKHKQSCLLSISNLAYASRSLSCFVVVSLLKPTWIIWFKSDQIGSNWIKFDLTYSNVQACFLPCLSTKINPHFKILFLIGCNLNMDWFIRTYVHGKKPWPLNRFVFTKKCLKPERPKRLSLPFRMRLNIFNLEINEQSCSIQSLVFNHSLTLIIFGIHL